MCLTAYDMVLQMFIGDKLVDSTVLSLTRMSENKDREYYLEEAMHELLEKWSDLINRQHSEVEFYIDGYLFIQE
jgi:hypothetical protein